MPSVAWVYDGGSGGTGVLTATITGATIGWKYKLGTWGGGTTQTATAVSTTVVLSITDLDLFGGQWISWVGDDHGDGVFPGSSPEEAYPIDTAIFADGVTTEATNDPSVTITYDGVKTYTLTTTHTGGIYFQVGYVDLDFGNTFTEDSISPTGPGTFPLVISGTPFGNVSVDVELDPTYYDVYGHGIIVYTGPSPIFLEAEDDYNSDPLYAALVTAGGNTYVTCGSTPEEYDDNTSFDLISDQGNCHPQFFIQSGRLPPNGRYTIQLKLRGSTNGATASQPGYIVIRRNGLSMTPVYYTHNPSGADQWIKLNVEWPTDNTEHDGRSAGPTAFPFLSGDVYEFCLFDQTGSHNMGVDKIRLDLVQSGGSPTNVPILSPPKYAYGTTWTDIDGRVNTTYEPIYLDMCVTDDGTIYTIVYEGTKLSGLSQPDVVVARSFDPTSGAWTTISGDLCGHGGRRLIGGQWVGIATDGTNVYFLFADYDGTTVGSSNNRVWRLKKWNGSTLTELGTGQRQIVSRSSQSADVGEDTNTMDVFVSPAGVPWVFWLENPDGTAQENFPHAWYWNGSSWVDTSLTPHTHTGVYYTASIVSNCSHFGVCFANPDGTPSENPFVVWGYQDGSSGGHDFNRLAFDLQRWNGSSWTSIQDFKGLDVWPDLRDFLIPPADHWAQGIHMFVWQNKVWVSAALGYGGGGVAAGSMAFVKADSSGLDINDHPHWDRDFWNTAVDTNDSYRSGWAGGGITTGRPVVDSEDNLWFLIDVFFTGYDTDGCIVISYHESGTGDNSMMGWRDPIDTANGGPNGGTYGPFQFMDSGFVAHGTTLYGLVYASLGSDDPLLLYKCERDDDYVAWTAGQTSIFWFYKDGQWRNQGVDTEYAIHFHEGGTWKKDTSLKGHLEGTWQT